MELQGKIEQQRAGNIRYDIATPLVEISKENNIGSNGHKNIAAVFNTITIMVSNIKRSLE